jgi:ABC-2 type transport system permease protein
MKNSKIWTIIKHEYLTKIRTKGFIIGTIIAPLGLCLIIAIPALITYLTMSFESETDKILINDKTGLIAKKIVLKDKQKYEITSDSEDKLQEKILAGKISAALVLNENSILEGKAKILTGEGTGLKFIDELRAEVNFEIKDLRLKNANIDEKTIELVNSEVNFETVKVTEKGTVKDNSEILSVLSYVLGFAMYMLMFIYGSQVMQGVIEEKANRIVEVLASSVTPFQIMFGKVVGIGAVGLTQVLFWLLLGGGLMLGAGFIIGPSSLLAESMNSNPTMDTEMLAMLSSAELPTISPWFIVGFIFYFLSGYFIFSTLFAAAGSTVEQMQDANSISGPLSIIVIIPILLIPNIMLNPEGTLAVVVSLIPFFTPILMIPRMISISIPLWQILLSIVLLIGTFFLCLKFAAKIYRIGMLSYGKKNTLKDIFKWAISK